MPVAFAQDKGNNMGAVSPVLSGTDIKNYEGTNPRPYFIPDSPSHTYFKIVKEHNNHVANVRKKARIEALRQRELARVVVYTKPVQKPAVRTPATYGGSTVWDRLAICESGGNWAINSGNGYYGGLQFSLSSWRGVGGQGFPHQASRDEQIKRAEMLKSSGGFGHWPACSERLGLL